MRGREEHLPGVTGTVDASVVSPGEVSAVQPIDYRRQLVLITGASSGLGVEFAVQLAARGADLILVARREDRLAQVADRITAATGVRVHTVAMDLGRADAGVALRERLDDEDLHPTALINNAGFATHGLFHEADQERMRAEVMLDVVALTDITRSFIESLRSAPGGFLVNIASIAGYQPNPHLAVYSAAKAYVLSLTESLWYEARGTGLRVLALSPGPARTEFFEVAGAAAGGGLPPMEASDVVATALRELDRPEPGPSVVPGPINKVVTGMSRLVPRRIAALVSGLTMDRAARQLGDGPRG